MIVEVVPENAIVRAASAIVSAGEPIFLEAGPLAIEVSADGFEDQKREIRLAPGEQVSLRLELEAASSVLTAWWFWTAIAVGVAAAIAIPVIALQGSDDPMPICYGDPILCERDP